LAFDFGQSTSQANLLNVNNPTGEHCMLPQLGVVEAPTKIMVHFNLKFDIWWKHCYSCSVNQTTNYHWYHWILRMWFPNTICGHI